MKVKIYDLRPYYASMRSHIDYLNTLSMDENIRNLGFPSCRFISQGAGSYWEMNEDEYTWFVLRFSV